jgi:hypothetical protein
LIVAGRVLTCSRRAAPAVVGVAVALTFVSIGAASARLDTHGHTPPRIGILGQGAWSWFQAPVAVNAGEQTFAGWVDPRGKVVVASYDSRRRVRRRYVVGTVFPDDHSAPAILIEPRRRLTVFWSGHNGSAMYYRTTRLPEDIRYWGPVEQVFSAITGPDGFTYPSPVRLPGERNRLYLFWRGADYSTDYATRTARGRWSPARELISAPTQRPYVKVDSNGNDLIALAYTDGHPRERVTSLYYVAYKRGWLHGASGRRIARLGQGPIPAQQGDLIYDGVARGVSCWVWDVALDARGRPVVVYATFPVVDNHAYWYARWTGRRWVSHFMTFAGPSISPGTLEVQYSGGITLDHSDPSIVYLSRKVRGWFEIERWATVDGGAHWRHTTVVPSGGTDNVRPVVPREALEGPMALLWLRGHYDYYTTFGTWIAYLR